MNKLTFNRAILLTLLFAAILAIADNSFLQLLSKRAVQLDSTIDPCECACSPMTDALQACASSTDRTCGCDAWIHSGPSCSACVGAVEVNDGSNITTKFGNVIFGVQITRAFCLCPDACATVANVTFSCDDLSGSGTDCLCSVYERDGPACSACINGFDQYAGSMMDNYIASCAAGVHFTNCTRS